MASSADYWYVRLPDGRTLRSRSTESLRQHLRAGRIPWSSRVRRSSEDPWQPVESVAEFADLALAPSLAHEEPPAREDRRAAPAEFRALGVRGLVEELFNALDCTLHKSKLTTASLTGLALGATLVASELVTPLVSTPWTWLSFALTGILGCIIFSTGTSILTAMTALELSRDRPARFHEIRPVLAGSIFRLTLALVLIGGAIVGVMILLRSLPGWLTLEVSGENSRSTLALASLANGARLVYEVICWPILGFAVLLLGPILIVEEHSVGKALREWIGMLRQHLGRIYLYQAIAFAFAAVLTLPLLAPLVIAIGLEGGNALALPHGEETSLLFLTTIAGIPALAFLPVAHVFIYLNLRYEFYSTRER